MRISDWSSDVCSSDLRSQADVVRGIPARAVHEYLDAYQERHRLAHTTVVLPTVYGPRQTTATESSVVAVFVQRALAGEPCRSEERRGGKERVSTCRSRLSPDH